MPQKQTPQALETVIIDAFSTCFNKPDVSREDDFFDLGGDSLIAVELCVILERQIDQEVHPSVLFFASTPEELAEALTSSDEM